VAQHQPAHNLIYLFSDVPNVIVLFTDGTDYSQPQEVEDLAKTMKNEGVIFVVVGLGERINDFLLREMASTDRHLHVYRLMQAEDVSPVIQRIADALCNGFF
jgi:hypothetical protein